MGGKGVALQTSPCHLQIPRHYGTLSWASREGRTGVRPYQKPDQTRTRIWVLCQEKVISLQSSAQAEAAWPDSCIQDQGTRKRGRIGRVKERKESGKGKEVSKIFFLLLVWDKPGTKRSQLWPLGLVQETHWLKPSALIRHHSNHLYELFYNRRSC